MTYRCSGCKENKQRDSFTWGKAGNNRQAWCKQCVASRNSNPDVIKRRREYYQSYKGKQVESQRRGHWLKKYGLSHEDYVSLFNSQVGKCANAACRRAPKTYLPVDHDHRTGAVRGLLCNQCNAGLGQFNDSVDKLAGAIKYLAGNKFEANVSIGLL